MRGDARRQASIGAASAVGVGRHTGHCLDARTHHSVFQALRSSLLLSQCSRLFQCARVCCDPHPERLLESRREVDVADLLSVRLILQICSKHAKCWEGAGAGCASEQSLGAHFFVNCSGAAACRLLLSGMFVLL